VEAYPTILSELTGWSPPPPNTALAVRRKRRNRKMQDIEKQEELLQNMKALIVAGYALRRQYNYCQCH